MPKPTAVRGFHVCYRDYSVVPVTLKRRIKGSRNYAEIHVCSQFPNGSTEAEFALGFQGVGVTASNVDMRLCAYDDALGFLASCSDLLTALAPLRDRCTVEAVRTVLLETGFVEFGA